jgi:hypothetical protein
MGLSTLRKVLRKLGFRWTQNKEWWIILVEYHIGVLRIYFKSVAKYISAGWPTVFVDGTYICGFHSVPFGWSDGSTRGLLAPVS